MAKKNRFEKERFFYFFRVLANAKFNRNYFADFVVYSFYK